MPELAAVALGIVASLLLFFLFSGAETAFISANQYRLRQRKEEGDARAGKTLELLAEPSRVLTAILIATNLANVVAVLLFNYLLYQGAPATDRSAFGFMRWNEIIVLVVLTPFIIIFSEILPKALFRARADELIVTVRPWLALACALLMPAIVVLEWIVKLFLLPFGGKAGLASRGMTRSDLLLMLHPSQSDEAAEEAEDAEPTHPPTPLPVAALEQAAWLREPDERRLIQNIIELQRRQAYEIMQPLVELEALRLGTIDLNGFLDLARESGHSRFPAFRDRIVNLIGYIDVNEVIRDTSGRRRLEDFLRPAHYVPETKRVDDLLQEFLNLRIGCAIAVDEFGGCSGWITREDIIERIVGQLEDELDEPSVPIKEQADGSYLIEGRSPIEDVNEVLGTKFDDDDCHTIGGLLMKEMGRVPRAGEEITLGDWRMRVADMDGKRVALVAAAPVPAEEA